MSTDVRRTHMSFLGKINVHAMLINLKKLSFSRYLIESLQKSYLISKKVPKNIDNYSKETTPFNQIFGGYMRQDVTCLRCKYVSTTFQHFMDLLLDIRYVEILK